ncbi:MAG: valine--tRNA ligase [Patescibacteria group bacterium]
MKLDFSQPYDFKKIEDGIYRKWEESGYFNPDKLPGKRKKVFTMVMAPPNITGSLHMGHALEYTLSDALARYKRMQGYKTLWLPGTDHAGIATQNAVEKELKKEGLFRHQLGREKFLEKVWAWREKYGHIIIQQLKSLGVSADWSRLRFTMDQDYQKAVAEAFIHYYEKGWIYRGERTINWCSRCATSLSDLEIEYKEEDGKFYYIKYGPLTLGTARPETKLGDTALAVNPKDKRYKKYVGKEIEIQSVDPSIPREAEPKLKTIKIKVIADPAADPEFGTGVIKVTPAHDIADFEIWQRHPEVPITQVIGPNGRMSEKAGIRYRDLKVVEARKQIVEDMQKLGLLEKIEEYKHNVAHCYRCGTMIEPMLSQQWFLKMPELAKLAIYNVKKGKIKFHPKRWEKVYFDWLKNIKDWCISRQIWWGHRLPVWQHDPICIPKSGGENNFEDCALWQASLNEPKCRKCLAGFHQSEDVLDTWFSSALWPFAALGWPMKTGDLDKFYPTDVLMNDRGIINLWDARMIFSGLEFMGKIPFRVLSVHATVLTREGQRMSKSLGTGIDPMELIAKYGRDAVRFAIIWQAMGGQDIRWSEDALIAGKKFLNKIWNASRFVFSQSQSPDKIDFAQKPRPQTNDDKKIMANFQKNKKIISRRLESYEFGPALRVFYDFFWHDFCDQYLESSKKQVQDPKLKSNTGRILIYILGNSLKILHPFLPHITEAIASEKFGLKNNLLIAESWPR